MGYKEALEAAGAEVLAFQEFGSYQGDWYAKVSYEGETFWVHDYYGSCTGCDAFEADVGWKHKDETDADYLERVSAFGARYLEPQERLTYEDVMATAAKNITWDSSVEEIVNFLATNA